MRKHEGNLEKSVPKALWWFTPIELKWTRQTHPTLRQKPSAHIVPLRLEDVEEQRDAVLRGCHQLPDAVLVGRILFGPAWTGDGPIQLGDEPPQAAEKKTKERNYKTNYTNALLRNTSAPQSTPQHFLKWSDSQAFSVTAYRSFNLKVATDLFFHIVIEADYREKKVDTCFYHWLADLNVSLQWLNE